MLKKILKRILKMLSWTVGIIMAVFLLAALAIAVAFNRANVTNGKLVVAGEEREYLLYVPLSYDPGRPAPLVISIHGFAEWPDHQRELSGWNELADEQGFIVVYPAGTGFPLRWRAGRDAGSAGDPMRDVTFISQLIDTLAAQYNIDPQRIYANGLSNGGGMSYVLGCMLSERIAAVGGVAGAYMFPLDECKPTRPVPMIAFHGSADPIAPYGGRAASRFEPQLPPIPKWILDRALLNECDPAPQALPSDLMVKGISYTGCAENASVVLYTIEGGGHSWPGGEPLPEWIVGLTSDRIDATRVMWEFFQQNPMNELLVAVSAVNREGCEE